MRRILITGGGGQIGHELAKAAWPDGVEPFCPDRDQLDIAAKESVDRYLEDGEWAAVINCAAWTAVDQAEDSVSEAFLANCQGPAYLAEAAARIGVPIVHVSTDYVFDGQGQGFYRESDPVAPLGAYGASKLAGELAVTCANKRAVVLRAAWVVSAWRTNFLKTMLRVGADRPELRVVADQFGCPTSAADIASALVAITGRLINDPEAPTGVYHFVNSGEASWFDLACHIFAWASARGGPDPRVTAIATSEYPTRSVRPANSRLDTSKITADYAIVPRPWTEAIDEILAELLPDGQAEGRN